MRHHLLRFSLAFVLSIASTTLASAASYTFQTVQNPNDPAFTQLLGINASGTIAGYYGDGVLVPNHGFTLVLPNTYTAENFPAASQTQVVGISNSGLTAGFYIDSMGVTHGFTNNGTTFTTVDAPGTAFNQLLGINNSGSAAGYSSTDPTGMTLQRSFVYSSMGGGLFTYIDGFLPAGTTNNQATGINNAGTVAGFFADSSGVFHGYLLTGGTTETTLDYPGGSMGTQAFGLNNNGEVVGDYTDAGGTMHGFTFTDGAGTWQTIDDPNAVAGSTVVNGVNDNGVLVGFYTDSMDNVDGFVATPVSEPGSLALLGSGALAGLGFSRRKLMRWPRNISQRSQYE